MIKAIWHRHWIDTVGGLIVAVPLTLLLCLLFYAKAPLEPMVSIPDQDDSRYLQIAPSFLQHLPEEETVQVMKALEHHFGLTIYASLLLVLFICGSGIRSNNLKAKHPSVYYNLTLPVSRTTMILTRYLMSVICSVVLMGLLLTSNVVVLWQGGLYVPFGIMLQTTLYGTLLLCTGVALYPCLAIINENFAAFIIPVVLIFYLVLKNKWSMEVQFAYPGTVFWVLGWLSAIGLCLYLAVFAAKNIDF